MYARENRFLREIVEYHQLNMQDVVNLDDDDDIEEEDDYDVDADDDEDAELEAEQHQDRRKSSPSQIVLEEEEEHQAADPGTEPQSPSRHTASPRMLSTNSGGGGGTPDHESPRILNTNSGGTPGHESPRMLNTNSGVGIVASESPRMLSTNSGGNTNESPRSFKDDGSSPETTRDG